MHSKKLYKHIKEEEGSNPREPRLYSLAFLYTDYIFDTVIKNFYQ